MLLTFLWIGEPYICLWPFAVCLVIRFLCMNPSPYYVSPDFYYLSSHDIFKRVYRICSEVKGFNFLDPYVRVTIVGKYVVASYCDR